MATATIPALTTDNQYKTYLIPYRVRSDLNHIIDMMKSLSLAALSLLSVQSQSTAQPSINAAQGTITGTYVNNNTVEQYLGIPYGSISNRFTYSTLYNSNYTNNTLNATTLPQGCTSLINGKLYGTDDCLSIDIWKPSTTSTNTSLPVFVWLPAGDFTSNLYQSGAGLVENSNNTIVVYVRYRVGAEGYLSLPGLVNETNTTSTVASGNYGTADQILALQWIQSNIHLFGGDNNAVTIGGEQAGSVSVCYLLNSPLASGLFRSAFLASGGCDSLRQLYPVNSTESMTPTNDDVSQLIATAANCSATNTTVSAYQAQVDCMRNLTSDELWSAYLSINPTNTSSNFVFSNLRVGPYADGYIVTQDPAYNFAHNGTNGTLNDVPLILGDNRNDGGLYSAIDLSWQPTSAHNPNGINFTLPALYTQQTVNNTQSPIYGEYNQTTEPLYAYYVNSGNPFEVYAGPSLGAFLSQEDIITTGVYACPIRRTARALSSLNQTVYTYVFHYNWDTNPYQAIGTVLGTDIPFWFYTPTSQYPDTPNYANIQNFTTQQSQLAAAMQTYLVNFIHNSDPNNSTDVNISIPGISVETSVWPTYNITDGLYLSFGNGTLNAAPVLVVQEPFDVSCNLWDLYVPSNYTLNVTCNNGYMLNENNTCVSTNSSTTSGSTSSLLTKLLFW